MAVPRARNRDVEQAFACGDTLPDPGQSVDEEVMRDPVPRPDEPPVSLDLGVRDVQRAPQVTTEVVEVVEKRTDSPSPFPETACPPRASEERCVVKGNQKGRVPALGDHRPRPAQVDREMHIERSARERVGQAGRGIERRSLLPFGPTAVVLLCGQEHLVPRNELSEQRVPPHPAELTTHHTVRGLGDSDVALWARHEQHRRDDTYLSGSEIAWCSMPGSLVNRALTPLAKALEHDDMQRLGIERTARLARWWNREREPLVAMRRHAYERQFEQLLDENGWPNGRERLELVDGLALDTSNSLPYLANLIDEMNDVIDERGLQKCEDLGKPYLQNILPEDAADRYVSLLDFGTSSRVIAAVAPTFGYIPHFSASLPRGIRLQESSNVHDPTPEAPWRDSQNWHRDYHTDPTFYVITLIREVTDACGPLHYVSASVSERVSKAFDYRSRHCSYRITDEQFFSIVDPGEVQKLVGQPGTTLFIDSSACFHMGSRNPVVPRYQTQYAYSSPVKSDFSKIIRKQVTYPTRSGDSTLRQMVCDRDWRIHAAGSG